MRITKVVLLPENENPAGRRRRPSQYESCVLPENENPAGCRGRPFQVPVLKLYYYQRTKIQPATGDGGSYYYKQEEEEKEKREEEVIIDIPSFLTVARISRSNLSWGGYCDVYITRASERQATRDSGFNDSDGVLSALPKALRPLSCRRCLGSHHSLTFFSCSQGRVPMVPMAGSVFNCWSWAVPWVPQIATRACRGLNKS